MPAEDDRDGTGDGGPGDVADDEQVLLDGFDRLAPQGSLRWGFDDALRRVTDPVTDGTAIAAWPGLPDDLWQRGRSAQVGQRFVGDVLSVATSLLAADARAVAQAAVTASTGRATGDALRYLAARIERLEALVDPDGSVPAELPLPVPEMAAWATRAAEWASHPDGELSVLVGEVGDGSLLAALADAGRRVVGVDPRGTAVWAASQGDRARVGLILDEVLGELHRCPRRSMAAAVLSGCVDRLPLAGQVTLLDAAMTAVAPGGAVVVLATDQQYWAEMLEPVTRDLAPGRPLHPDTWVHLLQRRGAVASIETVEGVRQKAVVGRLPS